MNPRMNFSFVYVYLVLWDRSFSIHSFLHSVVTVHCDKCRKYVDENEYFLALWKYYLKFIDSSYIQSYCIHCCKCRTYVNENEYLLHYENIHIFSYINSYYVHCDKCRKYEWEWISENIHSRPYSFLHSFITCSLRQIWMNENEFCTMKFFLVHSRNSYFRVHTHPSYQRLRGYLKKRNLQFTLIPLLRKIWHFIFITIRE